MSGPIEGTVAPPAVNENPNSPEAMLARDAKRVETQATTDSRFDTVLERFEDTRQTTITLMSVSVALGLLLLPAAIDVIRRSLR